MGGGRFDGVLKDVYITDKYTLVCEFENFSTQLMYYIGTEDRALISPPEMEAAGPSKWENQVGTGAFMFEEYVPGSYLSYVRNPNYYETATINGKKYQLPFVDRLVYPIIPDSSTQMAALRTGELDLHVRVPITEWETLDRVAPKMLKESHSDEGVAINLLCLEPPFDDVEVRRAMMIGTDMSSFARLQKVEDLPIHWYPLVMGNPEIYTPLEELPKDIQLLYDYNPDLAMDMLADAGYADGFETTFYTTPRPEDQDRAALLKDQWSKIGVDIEIVTVDLATMSKFQYTTTYHGACWCGMQVANPIDTLIRVGETGAYCNWSGWSDPHYDELMSALKVELDEAEVTRIEKEAALYLLRQVVHVPAHPVKTGHYWWPWLKNYYGELTIADATFGSLQKFIWIDQDLKTAMGY